MQEVDGGSQNLHLGTYGRDLLAVSREEGANGTQLFGAVLDVPDLIVKVPEGKKVCVISLKEQPWAALFYGLLGQVFQVDNSTIELSLCACVCACVQFHMMV